MMRKIKIGALLMCTGVLFVVNNYAQNIMPKNFQLTWGKEVLHNINEDIHFVGAIQNAYLGIRIKSKSKINLVKYDRQQLAPFSEVPILNGKTNFFGASDFRYEEILCVKDKYLFLFSRFYKNSKTSKRFAQEIDFYGNKINDAHPLSEDKADNRRKQGDFEAVAAPDSSKLLIVESPAADKFTLEEFVFKIFNKNLEPLNSNKIKLPFKDKNVIVKKILLANDGTIYLLMRINIEKKERIVNESQFLYQIIAILPDAQNSQLEFQIKLPEKYINSASIEFDEYGHLVCAGFYGKINTGLFKSENIDGVFYLKIDKTSKEITSKNVKEFNRNFVSELEGNQAYTRDVGIDNTYDLKYLFSKPDGGIILVAEDTFDYVTTICNGRGFCYNINHFVRGNLIVINLSPEGDINWSTVVPKYQHTYNDNALFSSIFATFQNNKLVIFFNDDPLNLYAPDKTGATKAMPPIKKAVCALVQVEMNGEFSRQSLFNNQVQNITMAPQYFSKINEKEFVFNCTKFGSYFLFLTLKKPKAKLLRINF